MLVVVRFNVPEPEAEEFLASARETLAAFAARPGYRDSRVGRGVDDRTAWVLTSEWAGVGFYRRALSAYEVRVCATPLFGRAHAEPSAYELL